MALNRCFKQGYMYLNSYHQRLLLKKESYSALVREVRNICTSSVLRNEFVNRMKRILQIPPRSTAKLRVMDNVSKDYELIYKDSRSTERYIKYGYPVAVLAAISSPLIVLYHYYVNDAAFVQRKEEAPRRKVKLLTNDIELLGVVATMTLFAVALISVMFKVPFRVYKHSQEQKYIAVFASPFPLKNQNFHFKTASSTKFRNPVYSLCFPECHFLLEKRKAILFEQFFRTAADLFDMIGED